MWEPGWWRVLLWKLEAGTGHRGYGEVIAHYVS